MNVLLIQPPEAARAVLPVSSPGHQDRLMAPPWNLLCLRSYLLDHTRHVCSFLDCRLFGNLERDLTVAVHDLPACQAAVVNTTSLGLGQTAAVLDILKRSFPSMRTVLCGQYPSQFPSQAAEMPRADYALAGDPEPILRNLLDNLDVEARLWRTPGLIIGSSRTTEPYWLPDLKGLSLPDWQGIFWGGYAPGPDRSCRILARLSRGHTHLPADRGFGDAHEPLRFWPMDRLAQALQKCGCRGVAEVFLADPPGIWTPERLETWCRALVRERNVQPWGFQLLPARLSQGLVDLLATSLCRRVEILVPSCDPDVLGRYGRMPSLKDLRAATTALRRAGILVSFLFWAGGPEERDGEEDRVVRAIRRLRFPEWTVRAFPFAPDAPIYEDFTASSATHIEDWVAWSRDPWIEERPVALWGGADAAPVLAGKLARIERRIQRNAWRVVGRFFARLRSTNWIAAMEDKALSLIVPPGDRPGE